MYGIMSDVHGNLAGLELIIAHGTGLGVTEWWSLGDVVGYGPYPVECALRVRDLCAVSLVGNHDSSVVEKIKSLKEGKNLAINQFLTGRGALPGAHWALRQFFGNSKPVEESIEDAEVFTCNLIRRAYNDSVKDRVRSAFGRWPINPSSLTKLSFYRKIKDFYADAPIRELGDFLFEYVMSLKPKEEVFVKDFGKGVLVHDNPISPGSMEYIWLEFNPFASKGNHKISDIFNVWNKRWPAIKFICAGHLHHAGIFYDKGRYLVMPGSAMVKRGPRLISYVTLDPCNEKKPFEIHYLNMNHELLDAEMIARGIPSAYRGLE